MHQFRTFVRKEFLHIFRDVRTMLILLVMPLLLICIFGFAISTEVKNSRVVVIDQMQTAQSRALVERIGSNAYFLLVPNTLPATAGPHLQLDAAKGLIQSGQADVILWLDPERGLQILADGSEPNQAQSRVGYLQNIVAASLAPSMGAAGVAPVNVRMLFNPQLKSEYNFVPGIIGLIIMLICAMMTSISIVREKEMGTMEVLLASPLPPLVVILAKLIPYFVISSINLISILLLSKFCFQLPIGEVGVGWTAVLSFLLLSMAYIFVSLALGLLISCLVNTQLAAMLLSLLLIVPALYLSGLVFPLESMPAAFQRASTIVPARWYMDSARRLLIQGVAFRYVLRDLLVLCLEAAVLVFISLKVFKTRLE